MQALLRHRLAEGVCGIWSALHKDVELAIGEAEVHYLRALAVTIDDDTTSCLLLRKLRLARIAPAAEIARDTVMMNSFLEFTFDGQPKRFGQLVHPWVNAPAYGISITTLLGAGLIGLRAGQTILWPDESGSLFDLKVLAVADCRSVEDEQGLDRLDRAIGE